MILRVCMQSVQGGNKILIFYGKHAFCSEFLNTPRLLFVLEGITEHVAGSIWNSGYFCLDAVYNDNLQQRHLAPRDQCHGGTSCFCLHGKTGVGLGQLGQHNAQTTGYMTEVSFLVVRKWIMLRISLMHSWTYCKGTVGKIFLIAVARASTIASASWLPFSSPVKNEYTLSPTVKVNCKKSHILNSR